MPGMLPNAKDLQELAATLRQFTLARRLFTYNETRAMAIRGTANQTVTAEWLFNQLDRARGTTIPKAEYQIPDSDDILGVFNLFRANAGQDLASVIDQIRSATKSQRAFSYNSLSFLVLRGAAAQMPTAERLIEQLSQP